VTDPKIIDVLIAKERMEYQETMNCWKMNDQLLGLLVHRDGGKPVDGTFLQKFYQGESLVSPVVFLPGEGPFPSLLLVAFGFQIQCLGVNSILIVCSQGGTSRRYDQQLPECSSAQPNRIPTSSRLLFYIEARALSNTVSSPVTREFKVLNTTSTSRSIVSRVNVVNAATGYIRAINALEQMMTKVPSQTISK